MTSAVGGGSGRNIDGQGLRFALHYTAQQRAGAALASFTRLDEASRLQTVMDAGMAIELLAKAYLAGLHPTLLAADRPNFDTLLHLSGNGHLANIPVQAVQTIGASQACGRCAELLPAFRLVRNGDSEIFALRNAGAHLAMVSKAAPRNAVRSMVRLAEPLIAAIGTSRQEFWGAALDMVDTFLDESAAEIEKDVEGKLHAARAALARRLDGLDAHDRAEMVLTLSIRYVGTDDVDNVQERNCPACNSTGNLGCKIRDLGPPEIETQQVDVDQFEEVGWQEQEAVPVWFRCQVCDLHLDQLELTALPSLAAVIALDPREVNPSDYYDGWEPDHEDYLLAQQENVDDDEGPT